MFGKTKTIAISGLISLGFSLPAHSQPSDWEIRAIPARDAIMAFAQFDNGITLVSRCVGKAFDVMIDGLPETAAQERLLQVGVGQDARMRQVAWSAGANKTSAFSRMPAGLARDLMRGGTIRIRISGDNGGPSTLYVMESEESPTAIAQTLAACELPLIDPRDSRPGREAFSNETADETLEPLPLDVEWVRLPTPRESVIASISDRVSTRVSVSCLTEADGRLSDCRIESAHPYHNRLVREVLYASRFGQLRSKVSTEPIMAGREIVYSVPIMLQ